jgi:hypothetical protein
MLGRLGPATVCAMGLVWEQLLVQTIYYRVAPPLGLFLCCVFVRSDAASTTARALKPSTLGTT